MTSTFTQNIVQDVAGLQLVLPETYTPFRINYEGLIQLTCNTIADRTLLDEVAVVVTGVNKQQYQVKEQHNAKLTRVFELQTQDPGNYRISALLPTQQHISGSPAFLNVIRDLSRIGRPSGSYVILGVTELDKMKVQPTGICWNPVLNVLLIPCHDLHVILVVDETGNVIRRIGGFGTSHGLFNCPTDIAFDSMERRVVVSDGWNHRIQIFTAQMNFEFTFGRKGGKQGEFRGPSGVAVSQDGKVIAVADTTNHRIQLFDKYGKFICLFTNPYIWCPVKLVFNITGQFLYFIRLGKPFVYQLNIKEGATERVPFNPEIENPSGISIDPAGNLIVTTKKSHRLSFRNIIGEANHTTLLNATSETIDTGTPRHVTTVRRGYIAIITSTWSLQFY